MLRVALSSVDFEENASLQDFSGFFSCCGICVGIILKCFFTSKARRNLFFFRKEKLRKNMRKKALKKLNKNLINSSAKKCYAKFC